jgi:hypothetical protein
VFPLLSEELQSQELIPELLFLASRGVRFVDALLLLAGIDHDRSSSPLDEGDTKVQGRTVEWSNPPRRGGVAGWAGLWWVLLADGCRRQGGFHVSGVLKNVQPGRAKGAFGVADEKHAASSGEE